MQLNRDALLEFVEWAEDHADSLVSYEESVGLITAIGFRCCLACRHRQENTSVVVTSSSPEELESAKVGVMSNIGPLTVKEYRITESGPNTWSEPVKQ